MIKIDKPAAPTILTTKGAERTQNDCDAFDGSPDDYRSGKKKFKFRQDIYGDPEVKTALKEEAQNDKCCYCEKLLDGYDVEHFRPQRAVKQAHGAGIQRPGYYWLVYAWDNLLVSCPECNKIKGTLFPLEDDTMRVRNHHNNVDIKNEQPLFINPATEEPRKHIRFRGAAVIPHKIRGRVSTRGRATIKGLKLERLDDIRGTRLSLLKRQRNIIELGTKCPDDERWQTLVKGAQEILNNAIRPEAEFSSMARDFLEGE